MRILGQLSFLSALVVGLGLGCQPVTRDFGAGGAGGNTSAVGDFVTSVASSSAAMVATVTTGVTSGGGAPSTSSSDVGVTVSAMSSSGAGPCPAMQVSCGGACVDVTTDGANCGACGHGCLGGACQAALCQPIVLASAQASPISIALDAKNIYWANADDGTIVAMPKSGEAPPIKLAAGQDYPYAVATDGQNVYWVTLNDGNVRMVPVTGGIVTTLATLQSSPSGIAVDDSFVYWITNSDVVYKAKSPTGLAGKIATDQFGVNALTVAEGNVYWTTSQANTVMRAAPGKPPVQLTANLPGMWDIAFFAGDLYIPLAYAGQLVRIPVTGGGATPMATGQDFPFAVAVDMSGLYWTSNHAGLVMQGSQIGEETILAAGQKDPGDIATDETAVYWVNMAGGAVMKLAK